MLLNNIFHIVATTMGVAPVPTIEKAQKTRRPARRTFMRALPHLVPMLVYFLYLAAGSWAFILIERDNLIQEERKYQRMMNESEHGIKQAIYNQNETSLDEQLSKYRLLARRPGFKLGRQDNQELDLTFSGSMLFCLITITTIGYGDIVPLTTVGRSFVVAYAAFGIPLNVIFLADVGYLFAKVIVKFIRALKLYKRRRKRAKQSGTPSPELSKKKQASKFGRKKYAKRGKKFKDIHKERSKAMAVKGGLSASRGMSVHANAILRNDSDKSDKTEENTSFNNHSTTPNGGRNLYEETSYPILSLQRANTVAAPRSPRASRNKSGGLSASRNMSVHARSLRRRAADDDDDDDRHYVRRNRGRRGAAGVKRKVGGHHHQGGISASRSMSVHARSIMRHIPEDLEDSEETTSNEEPVKTVSEGIESITQEILSQDIALTIPNSKSDADLVGNEHLSSYEDASAMSMASETTDKSSVMEDDDSVDTEVPTILVLTILLSYIAIGAVMMMYVEGWDYGDSLYFTIMTLTTIGYGDIAPYKHYNEEFFFTCIIYSVLGLAVMSTCIALVQAKVLRAIDKITRKIRKAAEL